ncbi:MAG: phytanoyl-CoA dioxygenase family protein [Ilumatobacteraceae bacterium]
MTATALSSEPGEVLERLNADGHVVVEDVIPQDLVRDLRQRVQRTLDRERAEPADPGPSEVSVDQVADLDSRYFRTAEDESERLKRRIRRRQADEFDTPWPVSADEVCISFIHIPTLFDDGRSQRIFNLINKDVAFAPLVEHPLVLSVLEPELGRDLIVLDMSVNHVGANTDVPGVWHIDSPLTQIPEPLPNFTLSIQTVWMLDDFSAANGATHVVTGSSHTQRKPPFGRDPLDGEVVLAGPAGSVAFWLSQTWHRHGANTTDQPRTGLIVQYGRSWIKPFVDLRTPIDDAQAAAFSPRLRYLLGCNASAPVRG